MRSKRTWTAGLFGVSGAMWAFLAHAHGYGLLDQYTVAADSGIEDTPVRVPEGVAFDPIRGDFYASAVFGGRITRIDGRTGVEETFFRDPTVSFIGMKFASLRRIVWVCAVDLAAGLESPISYVYAIAATGSGEGRLLHRFDLPDPFFCNDLALDRAGDVYATNSVGTAIMKIDAHALSGSSAGVEVFVDSPLLAPPVDAGSDLPFGQNGIVVTPDDAFVIVAHNGPTRLYRISRLNPTRVDPLTTYGDGFGQVPDPAGGSPQQLGADGLVFVRGKLYVVFGTLVQQLTFKPGSRFLEADVASQFDIPLGVTTATNAYGQLYVVDSEIHAIAPEGGLPIELPHSILRVDLDRFYRYTAGAR